MPTENTNMESFRGLGVDSGFKLVSPKPLDVRSVVKNATQLQEIINSGAAYPGLQVWVKDLTGTEYQSNRVYFDPSLNDGHGAFTEIVDGAGGDAYIKEQTYEGSSLTAIMSAHPNPNNGDIAIVKEEIGTGTSKYSYTAYFYDSTLSTPAWVAMDGNYSADNVYFRSDFTVTEKIGTIQTLTNGSATLQAEGKNLNQVLSSLLAAEKQPTVSQPSVSLTFNSGAYEVGSTVTPTYTASLSAGSYQYGPATGVTPSSWAVSNGSTTKTTASGSFNEITIAANTNYVITATATYAAGATAVTNLGNPTSSTGIPAGSKSRTSSAITGYYGIFYGYQSNNTTISDPTAITSSQVRAMTKSQAMPTHFQTTNMQQMYFAVKSGVYSSVSVVNPSNGAPQTVKKTSITVKDAGDNDVAYDLFYVNNAAADGETVNWTITAAS